MSCDEVFLKKGKIMKRIFKVLYLCLAVFMFLGLTGCNDNVDSVIEIVSPEETNENLTGDGFVENNGIENTEDNDDVKDEITDDTNDDEEENEEDANLLFDEELKIEIEDSLKIYIDSIYPITDIELSSEVEGMSLVIVVNLMEYYDDESISMVEVCVDSVMIEYAHLTYSISEEDDLIKILIRSI